MKKNTIFVQIASYKDPELIPTIIDITKNAKFPGNLKIIVAWQHGDEQGIEDFLDNGFDIQKSETYSHKEVDDSISEFEIISCELNKAKIVLIDIDCFKTKGACWARNLIQQFYNKEKYTLQLDSHHRFVENWDKISIDMLESVKDESPKPILTSYIPSYDPDNDPKARVQVPWKMNFDRFIPEGAIFFIPSTIDNWKELKKPIRNRFYSGHFAFADGHFAENVQHDPEYFFHGEEISIAARAFTHGYDLYSPHRIIAWHEYTRKNRTKIWDDHVDQNKNRGVIEKNWVEMNNHCHKRNRILFGMDGENSNQIDFGKYGFGTERTLKEYEEYAGVNFKLRGVQQYTLDQKEPPNLQEFKTEEEWLKSFITSVDVRICVHKNEFGELPDDCDFCVVAVHDDEWKELHRKDLTKNEFYKYVNSPNGFIDYRYICTIAQIPTKYTLWPHSKSQGWLQRVAKEVTDYKP